MHRGKSIRGSAMMELMLCLLPYALVMFGAFFLWYVQAGMQEVYKHLTSSAMAEGSTRGAGGRVHQGRLLPGSVNSYDRDTEGAYNAALNVDPSRDEPVLPYDRAGTDLAAALTRDAIRITPSWDGTINVHITESGSQLVRAGLIEGVVTGSGLDVGTDLGFTVNMEAMRDLSASFYARDFRATVVRGAAYEYTAQGRPLPFEQTLHRWRAGTMRFGGTDTQTALWINVGDPETRGVYDPGAGWNVDAASILEPIRDEGSLSVYMERHDTWTAPGLYDKDYRGSANR